MRNHSLIIRMKSRSPRTENDKAVVLELKVAQSDMGKVIGKQGRIAKAIRTVVKAAASKEDRKVIVEIMQ